MLSVLLEGHEFKGDNACRILVTVVPAAVHLRAASVLYICGEWCCFVGLAGHRCRSGFRIQGRFWFIMIEF